MEKIKFTKVREVKTPTRAFSTSAGIDFYMPVMDEQLIKDVFQKNPYPFGGFTKTEHGMEIYINPGYRVLIPSGIMVWFMDKEHPSALIAANKSGLSTKHGLVFTAQVVDMEYSGEMHIGISNTGDHQVRFQVNDKIAQFIHTPIILSQLEEVSLDEYHDMVYRFAAGEEEGSRGAGGFGSTDKK